MAAASTRNLGPTTTTFAWRLGGKARRAENNAGDRGTMVNAKACCGCRGHNNNGADAPQSSSNNSATSDRRAKSVLAGNAVRRIVVVVVCMGDGIRNGILMLQ